MTRSKKRWLAVGGTLVVGLVAFRIALPGIIKHEVNKRLDATPGYTGHIDDVDLWLIRGAYAIDGLVIEKEGTTAPVPFVDIPRTDLSVQWRELFRGRLVGQVKLYDPVLHFTNGPKESDDQAGSGVDWRDTVRDMFPLQINRLAVYDGVVHFADYSTKPPIDLEVQDLQVEARNLTNSEELSGSLVATVDATGSPLGLGSFRLHADVDPYSQAPTFDLDFQMEDVELKGLNPFLNAYAGFDVEGGKMSVYSEIACADGQVDGYVKPILTGARVFVLEEETQEDKDNPARVAWEAVVGVARTVLQNPKKERIASKIPITGSIDDIEPQGWPAVFSLLGNAYIKALVRGIDHDVALGDGKQAASAEDRREERREEREQRRAEKKQQRKAE